MAKGKKKRDKDRKKGKKTQAARADRYALYLQSVQAPDVDVKFFRRIYKSEFGAAPSSLREDFCGTAAICCEWVKGKPERSAFGVDIDPEPLAWGREHNLSKLKDGDRDRVQLIEGDVRTAETPKIDVICAQNFSYCCFKTREELRRYCEVARKNLADKGVFILDLFGGFESIQEVEEVTEHDGFDYVWDQSSFDPITHDAVYHIHFRFDDGSRLKKAFSYHWRLWTIPEIREILLEAGFDRADAYWEGVDEDGEGDGVYRKQAHGTNDPAWNAYIVGVKGVSA
jgi:SAM-dependent methyltransferase